MDVQLQQANKKAAATSPPAHHLHATRSSPRNQLSAVTRDIHALEEQAEQNKEGSGEKLREVIKFLRREKEIAMTECEVRVFFRFQFSFLTCIRMW